MLCSILDHYNGCTEFESNDIYNCLWKTTLNGDDLSAYDIISSGWWKRWFMF